jgi:ribosomal protein L40E
MTLAEFASRMTFVGELLTKIAIVGTGWGFYHEGLLSFKVSAASVCVGLLLSFGRDQSLRNRGIVRLVPNFGYVWAACMIMLLSTLWAVEMLIGTAIITSVRATAIASICAIAYSVYATTCEAAARQVFRWIFSCDEAELDRVTGRSQGISSDYPRYYEESEDCDDDYYEGCGCSCEYDCDIEESEVLEKKFCDKCDAIIDLDATRCWSCGYSYNVSNTGLSVVNAPRITVNGSQCFPRRMT